MSKRALSVCAGTFAALLVAACGSAPDGGPSGGAPSEPDAGGSSPAPSASADAGHTTAPPPDAGSAGHVDAGHADAGHDGAAPAMVGATIAAIALANVGKGACSTNSAGGKDYETSCTGNGGEPEYWCADFAQWVWAQAGVDTSGLDAAAGSFYTYGQSRGTLHATPSLGDAVVFNYTGDGVATHVALVTQVNADGTIETVSGDWDGTGSTEAGFSSTSHVVLNSPAYPGVEGSSPSVMGMPIAGFITPAPLGAAAGCYSDTLGKEMPANACVQSASDGVWYQCDDGTWVDRSGDPAACDGTYPLPDGG